MTSAVLPGQAKKTKAPVIRQVDQLLVDSKEPQSLFRFFTEDLKLPVVWPVTESRQYVSGAFSAGELTIELFRYSERAQRTASRFSGLVLQPYPLSYVLSELNSVGITHSPPEPSTGTLPKGVEGVLWTRVGLPSFSKPAFSVFLYEYSPAFLRVEVRRKQLVNRLRLNDGGPLGILSAKEIVISSTDLSKDKPAWELLLGKPDTAGAFTAGSGPSVRLVAGSEDHIREILLEVKSIDSARDYLAKQKLIGSASGNVLYLDPVRLQGLRIGLVGR